MRLLVAYCQLHPDTEAAALSAVKAGDTVIWADTSHSLTAYFELLSRHWAMGQTFVVLEQDKVPQDGVLRELYECPEPWCTAPHLTADGTRTCEFVTLGCTKLGASLMEQFPNLMERVGAMDMGYGLKHWGRIDMAMAGQLVGRGIKPHWHAAGCVRHEHQTVGAAT